MEKAVEGEAAIRRFAEEQTKIWLANGVDINLVMANLANIILGEFEGRVLARWWVKLVL